MFKYWSLKKYGSKLQPLLVKTYGQQNFYTPSQIRTMVYRKDFNPRFLPLGYLLFAESNALNKVMAQEFPQIDLDEYKKEILAYLERKSYRGYLMRLGSEVAA